MKRTVCFLLSLVLLLISLTACTNDEIEGTLINYESFDSYLENLTAGGGIVFESGWYSITSNGSIDYVSSKGEVSKTKTSMSGKMFHSPFDYEVKFQINVSINQTYEEQDGADINKTSYITDCEYTYIYGVLYIKTVSIKKDEFGTQKSYDFSTDNVDSFNDFLEYYILSDYSFDFASDDWIFYRLENGIGAMLEDTDGDTEKNLFKMLVSDNLVNALIFKTESIQTSDYGTTTNFNRVEVSKSFFGKSISEPEDAWRYFD